MECSNLIISSTVRMRLVIIGNKNETRREQRVPRQEDKKEGLLSELGVLPDFCVEKSSCFCFLRSRMPGPAVHFFLRKIDFCQHAAHILYNQVVDRFRMVIKHRYSGHADRTG